MPRGDAAQLGTCGAEGRDEARRSGAARAAAASPRWLLLAAVALLLPAPAAPAGMATDYVIGADFGFGELGRAPPATGVAKYQQIQRDADGGSREAQYFMGLLTFYGQDGVRRDTGAAQHWFRRAAAQGHGDAQTALGLMLSVGEGVQRDAAAASAWFRRAINSGQDDNAMWLLGRLYYEGKMGRSEEAMREARQLFKLSALRGNANGQFHYGVVLEYGMGLAGAGAAADAADPAGKSPPRAAAAGGEVQYGNAGFGAAAKQYELASRQGHIEAKYYLALLHLSGRGVPLNSKLGASIMAEAARLGHAPAMVYMGRLHGLGQGVPLDHKMAAAWLEQAAQSGDETVAAQAAAAREEVMEVVRRVEEDTLAEVRRIYEIRNAVPPRAHTEHSSNGERREGEL